MYPKPKEMGGTLIRKVIKTLHAADIKTPLQGPVDIACSSGPDSVALAHLLGRYGRNVLNTKHVTLLHFDHGWRKESALSEPKLVADLAKSIAVNFETIRLTAPSDAIHENIEADARSKRNAIYQDRARKFGGIILTAHHQDDVVETLVWRFFRGELLHQSEGILTQNGSVIRPFLGVTKKEIYAYLKEENLTYTEDPTNTDPARMRARLRLEVFPILNEMFPGFRESVLEYRQLRQDLDSSPSNHPSNHSID